MLLAAEETVRALLVHRGAEEESEHAAHLLVELLRGVFPFEDGFLIAFGEVVVVVGIRCTHGQSVRPCAELHVEPVPDRLVEVVRSAPVADHYAVEAPVLLQYLAQCVLVVAVVLVLVEVVGSHDAPSLTFLYGSLEAWQVNLMQGAVADDDVHLVAILLVVVQAIVLHAACHAAALQSLDVWNHHAGGQIRVFAHVLEVAASEGSAVDVHAGPQYHALAAIERFFAQSTTIQRGDKGMPCCCQAGEGREGHARVVGLSGLFPFVPKHVGTYAMRSVVGPEVGHAEALHASARELALCMNHVNLLGQGHATERILHASLDVLRGVEIDRCLCLHHRAAGKKEKG